MIHVAVGVICSLDGSEVLTARRPDHLHQGGLWEFPGGKVDAGEDVYTALCRELHEELGIDVVVATPWCLIEHTYTDKSVLLDVWRVTGWSGEPHGREGQPLRWSAIAALDAAEFPAANAAVITALQRGSV